MPSFAWDDPLDLAGQLTAEERLIRDTARALGSDLHVKAFTAVEVVHLAKIAKVYKGASAPGEEGRSARREAIGWVLRELKKALQFDSSDVSGVIEDLDVLLQDFLHRIEQAKKDYLEADAGGSPDERLERLRGGRAGDVHDPGGLHHRDVRTDEELRDERGRALAVILNQETLAERDEFAHPAHGVGLALLALVIVGIAENARIPIDNPSTHLELTMVHEAMILEYSGRHLAMIEAASHLKLVLYFSLVACLFVPFGMATGDKTLPALAIGLATFVAQLVAFAVLLPIAETTVAKMRVFRYPAFIGSAFAAAALAVFLRFVSRGF